MMSSNMKKIEERYIAPTIKIIFRYHFWKVTYTQHTRKDPLLAFAEPETRVQMGILYL